MRHSKKQAFTLVELLVVIAIIGTLVGLLLPAVQSARETARSNTCRNNIKQLQTGLLNRESSLGTFPGYINNLGVKGTANQIRASWVVFTFPYIEATNLWDRWSQPDASSAGYLTALLGSGNAGGISELELMICPSDPPVTPGEPHLAYGANAGWIQRTNSLISGISSAPSGVPLTQENAANGVFFDRSRKFNGSDLMGVADTFDPTGQPTVSTAYISSKGDGTTYTILLSENLHLVHWAHISDAEYGSSASADEKVHFGICWEQPDVVVNPSSSADEKARRINGNKNQDSYTTPNDITRDSSGNMTVLRDAMPSSNHPGGVNVAFVGGSVQFVTEQIEPRVYAQLMTSNRHKSDLVFGGVQEQNMAPISDSDF